MRGDAVVERQAKGPRPWSQMLKLALGRPLVSGSVPQSGGVEFLRSQAKLGSTVPVQPQ